MATGDRNTKGKATDIVKHYGTIMADDKEYLLASCGNKRAGYVTDDLNDVTCLRCLKALSKPILNK